MSMHFADLGALIFCPGCGKAGDYELGKEHAW